MKHRLLIVLCCFSCFACAKRTAYQVTRPTDIRWAGPALRPLPVEPPAPAYKPAVAKVYTSVRQNYGQAYVELEAMLEGRTPLNFKRAVFVTENAYFGNELDYGAYEQVIGQLAGFARRIGEQTPLDYPYKDSTNIRKNLGIYRLLCDTVPVRLTATDTAQHLPYRYDFEDFAGNRDWSRMFVTKLLVTRSGNCHSLPFLYRILAEELHAPAYLSLAPNHIYLQIPCKKTNWFNTELTSGSFPVDAWLMASGYVTLESIRNRVYMDTLGLKQSVALCALDLAKGIGRQNSISPEAKTSLMHQCVELALRHFPGCINARLLQTQLLRNEYEQTHDRAVYAKLEKLAVDIHRSGYLEMPVQNYADWLTGKEKAGGQNAPYRAENQRKGGIEGYTKPVLTLGKGRYDEFLQAKPVETVGAVKLDARKMKMAGFAKTNEQQVNIPAEVVSRFLSVDPIAASFPWNSPYTYAENDVIRCIDLDGLEKVALSGIVPPEQYYKKSREGQRGNTAYEPSHIQTFAAQAQRLKKQYGFEAFQVYTAKQLISKLQDVTRSHGYVSFISIFAHGGLTRLPDRSLIGGIFLSDQSGFYNNSGSYTFPSPNAATFEDLMKSVRKGKIIFSPDAVCFVDACNMAGYDEQGDGHTPQKGDFAYDLAEATGITVIAATGHAAMEDPKSVNGRFIIPDSEPNAAFYRISKQTRKIYGFRNNNGTIELTIRKESMRVEKLGRNVKVDDYIPSEKPSTRDN